MFAPLLRILKKHGFKLSLPILGFLLIYWIWILPPKYQGYAPNQPIPFSHKVHAGDLAIDCQFCHSTVERSAHASVPDTATCMKCHLEVAPDSEHIQYLKMSYKKGIPLRWNKVHDLPDHARFSHKVHIAKGLDCAQCHGNVNAMEKVEVHSAFNMGWCVNCHRQYEKNEASNTAKSSSHPFLAKNKTVKLTECGTCHY